MLPYKKDVECLTKVSLLCMGAKDYGHIQHNQKLSHREDIGQRLGPHPLQLKTFLTEELVWAKATTTIIITKNLSHEGGSGATTTAILITTQTSLMGDIVGQRLLSHSLQSKNLSLGHERGSGGKDYGHTHCNKKYVLRRRHWDKGYGHTNHNKKPFLWRRCWSKGYGHSL